MWILNICVFASASETEALILFHKTNFGNSRKLESIVNIFVLFIKISCQSKESPPFGPTPPFLEKIFHPHPYCQIRGTQS